ncbi:MAG: hypothetical protein R3Y07_00210 [Eubacteriales bacterium]
MKSPQDMKIIQIEITNACMLTCSNCTRLCGHHKKPFMMDFETFKRAVDSLEGYKGTVSLMGGEPTLHPELEKFAAYIKTKYPHLYSEEGDKELLHPVTEFSKTIQDLSLRHTSCLEAPEGKLSVVAGPGIYSTMGTGFLKHYEMIQDTFKFQCLNDHSNEMFHQPALISRKDLGIPDEEWIPMRDKCWMQNTWSASVTPKGAFFCEIAAALDILFDGPGGWVIEKDWWKRQPEDFADQLHWCEICGFACETFTRNANDQVDDVSPTLYAKLKEINSPKLKAGKVNLIEINGGVISEESKATQFMYSDDDFSRGSPYIKYTADKYSAEASVLHPDTMTPVYHFTSSTTEETMKKALQSADRYCDTLYAICETEKVEQAVKGLSKSVTTFQLGNTSFGMAVHQILASGKDREYFAFLSDGCRLTEAFVQKFKAATPNPGTLIYTENPANQKISQWLDVDGTKGGFAAILNKNASSLREIGFDRMVRSTEFKSVKEGWNPIKVIPFDESLFVESLKMVIQEGDRCAIFGAGGRSADVFYLIENRKGICSVVVDSDPAKQGLPFEHLKVQAPEVLPSMFQDIDRVLVGMPIYYDEMRAQLLELGCPEEKICKI